MLREYQEELAVKAADILLKLKIVYLAMEMRVGKTLISLQTASLIGAKKVLFVTKKKAIPSIIKDYTREAFPYELTVINYEQLHKEEPAYDCIIADEAHSFGAYPKPSLRTKTLKSLVGRNYLILLSGTPSPETYSQLYHQFWLSDFSPFQELNFYKWAKKYVFIKEKMIHGLKINDYSRANKELILQKVSPYILTYTRQEAGFKQTQVVEKVIELEVSPGIYWLTGHLVKNLYYKMKNGSEIVCDSAAKLQVKLHQIYSGTVKTETTTQVLDDTKARYILNNYQGKKIAVYYKFIAEGEVLRRIIPNTTEDPQEFKNSNKVFLSQIQSGGMGIDLSEADVLIFYNIDFSSALYQQARDRLQSLHRTKIPEVHWIFAKGGIEKKILDVVRKKKNYTTYYFNKDYFNHGQRKYFTEQNIKMVAQQRLSS